MRTKEERAKGEASEKDGSKIPPSEAKTTQVQSPIVIKDDNQYIPLNETSDISKQSKSNIAVQKQSPQKTEESDSSSIEISPENERKLYDSSDSIGDDSSSGEKDNRVRTKKVEIPIHQEIPSNLKAPNPKECSGGDSKAESSIVTAQPAVATAAFTALFSSLSPLSKRDGSEAVTETSKIEEEPKKAKKSLKKSRHLKQPNEEAVIVPLHGSSDEERETSSNILTREERSFHKIPDEAIPIRQSVVDEGDGLVQAIASNLEVSEAAHPEKSVSKSEEKGIDKMIKKPLISLRLPCESSVIVSDQSFPNDEEIQQREDRDRTVSLASIHELQTIQRIYGLDNNEQQLIGDDNQEKDNKTPRKTKKSKKRMFLKVPNEDAVYIPLHGSSDEEVQQHKNNDSSQQELSDEDEAPNKYGILVPLHGETSQNQEKENEEVIITSQPSVATAAFSALFGAFSPLAKEADEEDTNIKKDQNLESENTNKENNKSETKDENSKFTKKKRRVFKKVPNEDAVYVPLHSTSGEEYEEDSEKDQNIEAPHKYSVLVPLNDDNTRDKSKKKPYEMKDGEMSPGEEFAVSHPAVASATLNSFFIGVSPLGQSDPQTRDAQVVEQEQSTDFSDQTDGKEEEKTEELPKREGSKEMDKDELFSKPALAAAAFIALDSAIFPSGQPKNEPHETLKNDTQNPEKSYENNKQVKRKQRMFKKVPNQDAVYVPLHSSADEDDELIDKNNKIPAGLIETEEESPSKFAVFVPLKDESIESHRREDDVETVETRTLPGEQFAKKHPAVTSAALDSFFIAVSPLSQSEPPKSQDLKDGEQKLENDEINVLEASVEPQVEETPKSGGDRDSLELDIHKAFSNLEQPGEEELDDSVKESDVPINTKEINKKQKRVAFSEDLTESEDYYAESHPIITSAAFSSMVNAFTALGSKDDEESIDEEKSKENEAEKIDLTERKKSKERKSKSPDSKKPENSAKKNDKDMIIDQPSVATAAYTALFSAFSPLGTHDVTKEEVNEEVKDTVEQDDEVKETVEDKPKTYRKRIFKKVPNEDAVYIPLHSSSEEDLLQENETSVESGKHDEDPSKYLVYVPLHDDNKKKRSKKSKDKEDNKGKISTEGPSVASAAFSAMFNALTPIGEIELVPLEEDGKPREAEEENYTVNKKKDFKKLPNQKDAYYVPLHGSSDDEEVQKTEQLMETRQEVTDPVQPIDEKEIKNENSDKEKKKKNIQLFSKSETENVILSQPSVATAAFTALYSASFSPATENVSEEVPSEEKGKKEEDLKKVNDTVKEPGYEENNSTNETENKDDKALSKVTSEKQDEHEETLAKIEQNNDKDLNQAHLKEGSNAKENLRIEEKDLELEMNSSSTENNTKTKEIKGSPTANDALSVPPVTAGISPKLQKKDMEVQKPTIATAAFTTLFTAFSPLGESESAKEVVEAQPSDIRNEGETESKKLKKKKIRIFKKVPNENAVIVPLHSSSEEEKSQDELGETEEEVNHQAPNEYSIFVPLQENSKKSKEKEEEKTNEIEGPAKKTVATAAFTALFSAFSPLGSTENMKSLQTEEYPEALNQQLLNEEVIRKRQDRFKKVPNQKDALFIPLQCSIDVEEAGENKNKKPIEDDKPESEAIGGTKPSKSEIDASTKPNKSILKSSKSSNEIITSDEKLSAQDKKEKTVKIEVPVKTEIPPGEEAANKPNVESREPPEVPTIVRAKQTEIQAKPFKPAKLADIVFGVIKKKEKQEKIEQPQQTQEIHQDVPAPISCDHEYEPIGGVRAASQPEIRSISLDRQLKKLDKEEEDRYEVVKPHPEAPPAVQEFSPADFQTDGGYEIIEEPKKEARRCIKIPDQDAIIVPLHGSSDEEINPDRYADPALMMSEEEIETFPRQPLPYVTFNTEKKKDKTNESSFKDRLKNQADHFTTKLKGISKPKIVIHKPKRPNIKMPEMPKIKLPERPNIKMPEMPKIKFPDKSKFHLPERPKFLQEKPKFLTERPKFKLPERFTQHEKKPKAPRGKKPNPSSLRRPLRDVVTVSSQSTPGSSHNIFETLKFKTYPRFFKKKKAPLEKMSSLETESSQPSTPPRKPRRFSDQRQDTSWVHAYENENKFSADEEANLRAERMEEEYDREQENAQEFQEDAPDFQESYTSDDRVRAMVERELKQMNAESLTSVASEKGSSGSSSNRRRAGVIEEIDSDEFFVREKGLSREDVDVSRYLSLEIRDAFRQPKNALASLDNEFYDDDEERYKEERPRAPHRSRAAQKSTSADRGDKDFNTFPKRPSRSKESEPDRAKPPRKFRSKSGGRYQKRQSSMPSLSGDIEMGPVPEPPRRKSKERSLKSLNREGRASDRSLAKAGRASDRSLAKAGRASDSNIVQTQMTAQHSGDLPPVAPLRKSRSRGTSLADDDRTSRGADSSILVDDYEEEMMRDEEHHQAEAMEEINQDEEIDVGEEKLPPAQTSTSLYIEEKSMDMSGYATVSKNRKKPPRPPPPPQHHFDFHSQIDTIKATGRNIFFTYPRRAIKTLQKPMPQRPMRYNTIGPVRPPRRNRVFRKPVYMSGEPQADAPESLIDKERDLQSGEVMSRMKDRPLPAPPRPPRKSKDYETLDSLHTESSPTETIIANTEIEVPKDQPDAKESRSSYLKSKKDEFFKTISKYSPLNKKKDQEEEEAKEQTTTSQQTSFEYGEVSVSIQTDPLPKDVIVIDQEIEETEEILIIPDNRREDHEPRNGISEAENIITDVRARETREEEAMQKKDAEPRAEDSIFQQALERVEAARGVLKEVRERVTPGSTNSLEDKKSIEHIEKISPNVTPRDSLPTSPRSVELEKEETPPPLPERPKHTKPIPVSFPDKLHLSELEVDRLNVSEIQANKIKVSEIESTCIEVTELTSRGGNLTLNGVELPPDFISNVVAQVASQVTSRMSQRGEPVRELTPQRQERRMVTPPPSIIVQASPEAVTQPEPCAALAEPTERIPQPRTTRSKGRKSPTRVIDDSEDELATIMPQRREKEKKTSADEKKTSAEEKKTSAEEKKTSAEEKKTSAEEKKTKIEDTKAEDPPVETHPNLISSSPSLRQASSFQLMGQLFSIWQTYVMEGAGTFAEGVNALFPEGEKRRDAQIAAVILLIIITGLIIVGFGFDSSVHHHHWDYLPPR